MTDSPQATLQVPTRRELSKLEEIEQQESLKQQQHIQQQHRESKKLTKREFGLLVLIVILTLVVCCLVGFIIGWFLWPHEKNSLSPIVENDGDTRTYNMHNDNVPQVNTSTGSIDVSDAGSKNVTTCLTTGCLKAGLSLINKMDPSVYPCRDFRSYTCGRMDNSIYPQKHKPSVNDLIKHQRNSKMLKLLKSKVGRIGKRSSERKIKQLFKSCMETLQIKNEERRSVLQVLESLGGWPAIGLWSKDKAKDWRLSQPLEYLQLTLGVDALFSWSMVPDFNDSSTHIIRLSPGGLTLTDRNLYHGNFSEPVLKGYRRHLRSSALLLGATGKPTNRFVSDVFTFEKKLAKIPLSDQPNYNKTSLYSLINLIPEVDWQSFFRSFPGTDLSTMIWIDDSDYFRDLNKILTTSYPRILQNYLAWRFVSELSPYLSEPFRNSYLELMSLMTDDKGLADRADDCVSLINRHMGIALDALVVKDDPVKDAKKQVKSMAQTIKEVFVGAVERVRWMDDLTKINALQKAASLQVEVGYPEFLRNTVIIDNYYADYNVEEDQSLVEMVTNITQAKTRRDLQEIIQPVNQIQYSWITRRPTNISYNPRTNTIVVPATLFQYPIFDLSYPRSFNFGSLGALIGREMLQSLIGTGANFDENGNFNPWWTNETSLDFKTEMSCLSQALLESENVEQGSVGNRSFEHAFDIGGLILSYKGWTMLDTEEQIIPGANLTTKQVFFVAFAQSRCDLDTSDNGGLLFKAINRLELFGLEEFRDVFKCIPEPPSELGDDCVLL